MQLNPKDGFSARFMIIVIAAALQACQAGTASAQDGVVVQLTLPQAIDLALKQNRTLKLAQLAVLDSEQKKNIARAAYLPRLQNESTVIHVTDLQQLVVPAGSLQAPGIGPIPTTKAVIGQGDFTGYTSGTGLSQPLLQLFKTHQENRAAAADIESAKDNLEQAKNDVALMVRQLYYRILIAQQREEAAKTEEDAAQIKLEESTNAVEQGSALEVVALESRAATLDAKQAILTQSLQIRDFTFELNNLLGLPLTTKLQLTDEPLVAPSSMSPREECVRIASEHSPDVRAAQQVLAKAKAGVEAAKDAYIPNLTVFARYSYQSGIPFLVHNFGTFGATFEYELFDGGRRKAEIDQSRTTFSKAQVNLDKVKEEVAVQVELAYDKVDQMLTLVTFAEEALKARTEAARLAHSQFEQGAALASARADAAAKMSSAKASLLEAHLGLSLAQAELKRVMGELPR
jgi:outer membrane protein TolC